MKQNRLERVIRGMEAMGLEQIIVSAPASVFYLTGTWVRPGERMLALYVHKSGGCSPTASLPLPAMWTRL